MSGGHWDYLAHRIHEHAGAAHAGLSLLASIEHHLDWGYSADTCPECAELRTLSALRVFFDGGATDAAAAGDVLEATDVAGNTCDACLQRIVDGNLYPAADPLRRDRALTELRRRQERR